MTFLTWLYRIGAFVGCVVLLTAVVLGIVQLLEIVTGSPYVAGHPPACQP